MTPYFNPNLDRDVQDDRLYVLFGGVDEYAAEVMHLLHVGLEGTAAATKEAGQDGGVDTNHEEPDNGADIREKVVSAAGNSWTACI